MKANSGGIGSNVAVGHAGIELAALSLGAIFYPSPDNTATMWFFTRLLIALGLETVAHWLGLVENEPIKDLGYTPWPHVPLRTHGRYIVNTRNETVRWAGVNWPLSGESMIPEGLEFRSADEILDSLQDIGFNFIRMGYASEMVDQVYDGNGQDVTLRKSLRNALGRSRGQHVFDGILSHNRNWNENTTRFEAWGDIIDKAAERQIFVHPDLHVGKASWCCSGYDGNAWFDDANFPVSNWTRALTYIAEFAKDHPNVASMSLRNEMRRSYLRDLGYNWENLIGNFTTAADAIHKTNPHILIAWSGMGYDTDIKVLTTGQDFTKSTKYKNVNSKASASEKHFLLSEHPWANKIVWELHRYGDTDDCETLEAELYRDGFNALGIPKPQGCGSTKGCSKAVNVAPVLMGEFGYVQDSRFFRSKVQKCLRRFIMKYDVPWSMWVLAGSYRIRSGLYDFDETWGMKNHNWSDWRDPQLMAEWWKPFVQDTLSMNPQATSTKLP